MSVCECVCVCARAMAIANNKCANSVKWKRREAGLGRVFVGGSFLLVETANNNNETG